MAHVTTIVENISTVARMTIIDEQLMDVQECSTRHIDFSEADYEIPPEIKGSEIEEDYKDACGYLFDRYKYYYNEMLDFIVTNCLWRTKFNDLVFFTFISINSYSLTT